MIYDFRTQLKEGHRAEQRIDSLLEADFRIEKATREQQRQGIDRILTHWQTGQLWRAEYKADLRAKSTGNAFVETMDPALPAPHHPERRLCLPWDPGALA